MMSALIRIFSSILFTDIVLVTRIEVPSFCRLSPSVQTVDLHTGSVRKLDFKWVAPFRMVKIVLLQLRFASFDAQAEICGHHVVPFPRGVLLEIYQGIVERQVWLHSLAVDIVRWGIGILEVDC